VATCSSMKWKWVAIAVVAAAITAAIFFFLPRARQWRPGIVTIQGAVIRADKDTRRELPISGVTVTVWDGRSSSATQSDSNGYYKLSFRETVWPSEQVTLSFRSPDYKPQDIQLLVGPNKLNKLYVAALDPVAAPPGPHEPNKP